MRSFTICRLCFFYAILFSCKREIATNNEITKKINTSQISPKSVVLLDNDEDTTYTPTILGVHLPNPYLVPNMKQAYINITGQTSTPAVTNLYVRFKPSGADQLRQLDSIMAISNIDFFDTPLDYEILTQGDYYQDPSIPLEQVTWQYAVVATNFSFPSGIQYEVLSSIHIPTNSAVEQEAERLAGLNADGDGLAGNNARNVVDNEVTMNHTQKPHGKPVPNIPPCPDDFHWDYTLNQCVANNCPSGYTWDNTLGRCIFNPPPTDPTYIPGGKIMVFDTQLDVAGGVTAQPLRNVKLVAHRWFKVEKTATDNNGNFTFTKNFRRKVKLKAKFINQYCTIRGIRNARLWEMLVPVEKLIGTFSGSSINTVSYIFKKSTSIKAKGMRNWAAATILNGVQEHKDYATSLSFSAAPTDLNIYITNWTSSAATPLFHKRVLQTLPTPFINTVLISDNMVIAGGITALTTMLTRANIDIAFGYNTTSLASDAVKETIYHEMSHASHYTKAGTAFYTSFVNAELNEISLTLNTSNSPYGAGTDSYAPIIALGEGWAYFMGHYLADRRYTTNCSQAIEQGIGYTNGNPVAGLSSHLNLLEDFNPRRIDTDPFFWIPQGLMYDLMDNRNDNNAVPLRVPLDDIVSGYTIPQIFNALQSDINSMQSYKVRLLTQNANNQLAGVNTIFTFYGYQ